MRSPLSIAVISDLHAGFGTRAADLYPYAGNQGPEHKGTDWEHDNKKRDKRYKQLFLDLIRKEKPSIDYLVIAGDISHESEGAEVKVASELLVQIISRLKINLSRVFFVPGNHDVDWKTFKAHKNDPTGIYKDLRYYSISQKKWLFGKIIRKGKSDLLRPPYLSIWERDDILVCGFNSSWNDDPFQSIHHGSLTPDFENDLRSLLQGRDLSNQRLKIFVTHHHPILYPEVITGDKDFSTLQNAPLLLKLLREFKFDLVIHGHMHRPFFSTELIESTYHLPILCAGSFSAILDSRWNGSVNNQFHIVKVQGRSTGSDRIYGRVLNWTFLNPHGWKPSHTFHGMPASIPFGDMVETPSLIASTRPILEECFSKERVIEWQTLMREVPLLREIPFDQVNEVLRNLSNALGFKIQGEEDEIVLIKK